MQSDTRHNDDSRNRPDNSARRKRDDHEFAEVARSLAKPPVIVRLIRASMLYLFWIGASAWSMFYIWTGFEQVVTQTGVTAKKGNPTPIHLTGTVAVINGVCLLIIGLLVLAVCLLPFRVLWKRHTSKTTKQQEERNS